ncbi:MAG: haloacid dehalogenase type II [Rhodospirillales bacterium]|mgnify:FL=1|uniref:haloacid dehalogenase type II n=1 Tax=Hwanghaeella sp. 1Z406 TaxID=3402811 RepID=UPI000C92BE0F|nr:haloacid dehalogenase type II [Rhodospirillales bacterium]
MVKALIFDVFGTVVDWRNGVANAVRDAGLPVDPLAFADAWRGKYQPKMQEVRSGNRPYVALDILHLENLESTLADFGLQKDLSAAQKANLNRGWEKLPPWPDSVLGLNTLKRHFTIGTCSNGSVSLMTNLAKFGSLPWDHILGAEIAQGYKPDPKVYLASAAALDLPPDQVMMVAAHNGDLAAARATGLKTAFFPRPVEYGPGQKGDLKAESNWDVVANDLVDLAQIMVR